MSRARWYGATRIESAEQVVWIVDGAVTMTIGDETKELVADDVVVVNPGIEHELVSEGGVTFVCPSGASWDWVPTTGMDALPKSFQGARHRSPDALVAVRGKRSVERISPFEHFQLIDRL